MYFFANQLIFCTYRTESNIEHSDESDDNVGFEEIDEDIVTVTQKCSKLKSTEHNEEETISEHQPKKKKVVKKQGFEDNLNNILNNRKKVDADTSFALSIVPLIKNLNDEQKTQVYIDILKSIQKVKEPKISDIQTTSKPPKSIQPYVSMYPAHAYDPHSNPTYSNIPQSYVTSPAFHPNNSMHYNHPHFNPITPTYYPTTSTPNTSTPNPSNTSTSNPSNTSIPYPSNISECEIQNFNMSKPFQPLYIL